MSVLGRRWGWLQRLNATLVVLVISALVAYLGVLVVGNFTAARNAVTSLDRARMLTARRID